MGEAIGGILGLAVGVAISPIPIIAVVLILFSPTARINGPLFLLGWLLGLTAACSAFVLLGPLADGDDPGSATGWVKIAIGALFLVVAVRQWRSRPRDGEEAQLPGWMAAIAGFPATKALGMGALLSIANPKNLGLSAAAGASISTADLSTGQTCVVVAVFVLLGASTVAVPVLMTLFAPGWSAPRLSDIRTWLTANNATVMMVLFVVLGAKLVGDGLAVIA